jgi:cellulose synthase/poly-beta-1,6-N-acetylglucosamine synthase-like glycosyltransferase
MNKNMGYAPVSIVIPAYNAEKHIRKVVESVLQQDYKGEIEIIVINDGSNDNSLEIVNTFINKGNVIILNQSNQGAVIATNKGFEAAKYDIVCSVDSDVVLHKNWLKKIIAEFDDSEVGAVQGYYKTPKDASFWIKMMGYDIEKRYDDIKGKFVTQVCTGNTAYRKSALDSAGLFDPGFEYAYDNDMSYRLLKAGYKLVFKKDALCDHYWKEDFKSYISQQFKSAFGRMQLISKHKERFLGDSVSGIRMIFQVPLTLLFFLFLVSGSIISIFHSSGAFLLIAALCILLLILIDRFIFTIGVFKKQKDPRAFLLPFVHLLRNTVWCCAFLKWCLRLR